MQYNPIVIRKHLSLQLALVLLVVSLVPLLGVGLLTLHLIEQSVTAQVTANHDQLATVSDAMLRDYMKDARTKLKSISHMINRKGDPDEQTRRLNTLLDPPDIFLEVSYWTAEGEVYAQVQQEGYNKGQTSQSNRDYNPRVNQYTYNLSTTDPLFAVPIQGGDFAGSSLVVVKDFPALPISVPAPGPGVLIANVDFRPVSQMLANVAGSDSRVILLVDADGKVLAESRPRDSMDAIETTRPAGHGGWGIVVRESRDRALAPLRQARMQAFLWFGLAFVMATGLAALFAGRVLRPVRSLARTAESLGRGDFSARSGISREDEIGQLAQAFDRMAAAVQQLDQMKGEFVSHVSHELRTPLTSAKMTIANVQEGISGPEALARVQQDIDRLIRMVNELLDVARLDAGIQLAKQPADLGEVARSSAESLRPMAKVPLEVTGRGDVLDLDRARVQQILVNLIDNALKYAKSRVDVTVEGREVRVTDDGPGVPPEARERIFEKFARVETGAKPPGVGLGLSIARKLAELHGGTLRCEGNTFVLRF